MAECCDCARVILPPASEHLDKIKLRIKYPDFRYGYHPGLDNTLFDSLRSHNFCKCLQLFMGDPTTYECRSISAEDKAKTLQYCKEHDKTFYIHCPYILNLAKPEKYQRSVSTLTKQLSIVAGLPAACVLHIGKVGTIDNICQRINEIQNQGYLPVSQAKRVPFHLLLEVAAGQATEIGRSWEEIRHIYEGLDRSRVGLCLDTQHAFAAGMSRFDNHESVVKLFDASESIMRKGISMIHLNDSKVDFGHRVDRHASLRNGYIWRESDEGLKSLIALAKDSGIDLISETDDPFGDMTLIRSYQQSE